MKVRLSLLAVVLSCATAFAVEEDPDILESPAVPESTTITFTRAEVAQMAALWETDTIAISPLANSQYPTYTTNWQYIFPHTNISTDGDVHAEMAVDSAGSGSRLAIIPALPRLFAKSSMPRLISWLISTPCPQRMPSSVSTLNTPASGTSSCIP